MMVKKIILIFMLLFIPAANTYAKNIENAGVGGQDLSVEQELLSILKQAESSPVYAEVLRDCEIREEAGEDKPVIGQADAGTCVEILEDKTKRWYRVRDVLTDEIGWLPADILSIPEDEQSGKTGMNAAHKERFAEIIGFKSETDKFVWVDLKRQEVNIFEKDKGTLRLAKIIPCSTGKNESPTLRGFFKVKERGVWFYSERLKSGAKFWVRFHGSYLFHSVPMNREKKIIDTTIGEKSSSGCVRMALPDAEWFYNNVEDGTGVFIH